MKWKFFLIIPVLFIHQYSWGQSQDTLRVGYYKTAPFIYEQNGQLQGVSVWLWEKILAEYPVPHELVEVPLNGLVESMAQGAIDLSIVPLTITKERSELIDFSPPYYVANSSVLIPTVGSTQKVLLFLGSFFNLGFVKAIGALLIIISAFGFLLWLFEKRKNIDEFGSGVQGIWDGIWWSAVTMTTVGYGDKSPRTAGGKVVALVWMFVAIMIISGFMAAITSSLTVSQLGWTFDHISDIKEKKLGTIGKSATETWLSDNFFNNVRSYQNTREAIKGLSAKEIDAIAYDNPPLQYYVRSEENTPYEVLPISYNQQMYALGFSESLNPKVVERISNELLKVTESRDWSVILSEYGLRHDD